MSKPKLSPRERDALGVSWRAKDIRGQRFGRLVAVRPVGRSKARSMLWLMRCDCGNEATRSAGALMGGRLNSCGCLLSSAAKARIAKLGGPWNIGRQYQIRSDDEVFRSLAAWRAASIRRFGSACVVCGWAKAACDVHHRIPRSEGGKNTILNAIVVCPNCHRVAHEHGLSALLSASKAA